MARFYAQDCRNSVITLLQDSSSGFNVMIGTVNTERTHTAPTATGIVYNWGRNQFPFLLVDVRTSEVNYESAGITLELSNLPEVHNITVYGYLKAADDNINNWVEDWIEAIIRVLHDYCDSNITWIAYTSTDRDEIYKNENEVIKVFGVNFEVRIN